MNCLKQATDQSPKYIQINKIALAQPRMWSLGTVTIRTRHKWQEQTQGMAEQGSGEPWDATDGSQLEQGCDSSSTGVFKRHLSKEKAVDY